MRSIVAETAVGWGTKQFYVGCSGNFTIERILRSVIPSAKIHSNDVSIYSCVLGWYLSGQPVLLSVKDDMEPEWGWLNEFVKDPADAVATVFLCTRMLEGLSRQTPFHERQRRGYKSQWPNLHSTTAAKVRKLTATVNSFYAGDVMTFLSEAPETCGFLSFPPFYAGGYETMFKGLTQVFDWDEPEYKLFGEGSVDRFRELAVSKEHWLFATNFEQRGLSDRFIGYVKSTPRNVPFFVYASSGQSRVVQPRQKIEPILRPKLSIGDEIGDVLSIERITQAQLNGMRSRYLDSRIPPAAASRSFAVLVGGVVIGAFALSRQDTIMPIGRGAIPTPAIYLLSDFPVEPTDYQRLSKLIVIAAASSETRVEAEKIANGRIRSIATTAFTDNPVSMKYRGVLKLISRKQRDEDETRYMLNYGAEMGQWTLQEGLVLWKSKHGIRKT